MFVVRSISNSWHVRVKNIFPLYRKETFKPWCPVIMQVYLLTQCLKISLAGSSRGWFLIQEVVKDTNKPFALNVEDLCRCSSYTRGPQQDPPGPTSGLRTLLSVHVWSSSSTQNKCSRKCSHHCHPGRQGWTDGGMDMTPVALVWQWNWADTNLPLKVTWASA